MAKKYFTTPRGIASYPKLVKPDTKFNPAGVYSTGLILSAEDAEPLIEQIKEVFVDEFGQKKLALLQAPWKETEEGDFLFKFKSNNRPQIFDAAGKPVNPKADLKMGGGSTLKIKGSISPIVVQGKHYATLYINGVQLIDMVEFGGASFAAEEGSYSAENDTTGDDEAAPGQTPGDTPGADDAPEAQDF